jgi:hypothetical protein
MWVKALLVIVAVTVVLSCASSPQEGPEANVELSPSDITSGSDPTSACVVPPNPKRPLLRDEVCMLNLAVERCLKQDVCLVDCVAHAKGDDIGGGCFHLCYSFHSRDRAYPAAWQSCI